jgi:3-hydroxybutyryl-CoA dehydrogenase
VSARETGGKPRHARRWITRAAAETERLGAELAAELGPDGVLLLTGELGSGKTVLARGVAAALGVDPRQVVSPTFNLIREHRGAAGRPPRMVHVDLYRLEPREAAALGLDEVLAGAGVKVVEWAERLPEASPAGPATLALHLRRMPGGEDGEREIVEIVETVPREAEATAMTMTVLQGTKGRGTDMKIRKVGVLGCGLMGAGIAEVAARAGFETLVREVSEEVVEKGLEKLRGSLDKAVERGKLDAGERDKAWGRLHGVVDLGAFAECDLVVEAIVENLDEKRRTFAALDAVVKEGALFASNTSSLTITQIAMATRRPDRFVGLHFFNPVPVMKLVEVVRTLLTSQEAYDAAIEVVRAFGKEPVTARDNSGFLVNRLLVPYLLDAVRAYEEGVGSIEDIDKAMQLGCGYPMGPFTLLDFVGLDTTYYIANIMFDEYREKRFAPPPLLKQMVLAGRLGRKSGRGFYEHPRK